ncbi:MAG: ATP-binding protein [Candidatus Omnitrophota bacterium]
MNWYKISTLLAAVISFGIGGFVYSKSRKNETNLFFALLSLSVASWCFSSFMVSTSKSPYLALWYGRLFHIPVIFMPPIWLILIFSVINEKIRKDHIAKPLFILSLFLSSIFTIILFSKLFFIGVSKKFNFANYFLEPGICYLPFMLYWTAYASFGFIKLFAAFKSTSGYKRHQLRYFFVATFIGSIAAIIYFALIYGIKLIPIADSIIILYLFIMAYAIVRYRVMDIKIVFTRAVIFTLVYALVLGLPFYVSLITPKTFHFIPLILMALLASAGPFIYMRLQKRVEARLRAEEFKAQNQLRSLSHNMLRFTRLEDLLKLIVHYLVKIFRLKFAAIYLVDKQNNKYVLKSYWYPHEKCDLPAEFKDESILIEKITKKRIPLVTEEMRLNKSSESKDLLTVLTGLKINTIIPSFIRNDLLGFLVLSDRKSNTTFSQEDLNLLMLLSNEASLAIENAQFHQKERSVLAEKSRREALADMAPGASHQFNNRLAAISTTSELLLINLEDIDLNTVKDENIKKIIENTKKSLDMITQEVFKGKEITSAILKRAKAKVEFQKVDIKSIISNAHKLVLISKGKSGISGFKTPNFKLTFLNEIPLIFGSEALLQDCFYNHIDNAFDAMNEIAKLIQDKNPDFSHISDYQGNLEITLENKDSFLEIIIKDNGIGLKKENMRKLFTPYFTTKATANKGSGLGLYVIRDFIEMHKGTITCSSEYGKGTTFTIKLPIKNQ